MNFNNTMNRMAGEVSNNSYKYGWWKETEEAFNRIFWKKKTKSVSDALDSVWAEWK